MIFKGEGKIQYKDKEIVFKGGVYEAKKPEEIMFLTLNNYYAMPPKMEEIYWQNKAIKQPDKDLLTATDKNSKGKKAKIREIAPSHNQSSEGC